MSSPWLSQVTRLWPWPFRVLTKFWPLNQLCNHRQQYGSRNSNSTSPHLRVRTYTAWDNARGGTATYRITFRRHRKAMGRHWVSLSALVSHCNLPLLERQEPPHSLEERQTIRAWTPFFPYHRFKETAAYAPRAHSHSILCTQIPLAAPGGYWKGKDVERHHAV